MIAAALTGPIPLILMSSSFVAVCGLSAKASDTANAIITNIKRFIKCPFEKIFTLFA
jgi:hypothetical protein